MRKTNKSLSVLLILLLLLSTYVLPSRLQAEEISEPYAVEIPGAGVPAESVSTPVSESAEEALGQPGEEAAEQQVEATDPDGELSEQEQTPVTESEAEVSEQEQSSATEAEDENNPIQPEEENNSGNTEQTAVQNEAEKTEPKSEADSHAIPPALRQEPETVHVTLIVECSKLLESKADQANAHEEWLNETVSISGDSKPSDLFREVIEANPNNSISMTGGWINSIKIAEFPENITGVTNGTGSSWMWYIKNSESGDFEMGGVSSTDQPIAEGEIYKLQFTNDPLYPPNIKAETPENPIILKENGAKGWTGYRGDGENKTPVREVESMDHTAQKEKWSYLNESKDDWGFPTAISDLLSINGKTFYATKNQLVKLNENGAQEAALTLAGNIQYLSRLAYGRGMIIVPLQGGGVQAVDPETMRSLWVVASKDAFEKWTPTEDPAVWEQNFYDLQSLGSTYIDLEKGIVYVPITAPGPAGSTVAGMVRAIDMSTGREPWNYSNSQTGYYWGGAAKVNDLLFIGNDQGEIEVIDQNGQLLATSEAVSAGIRSTIINQGNTLYFTSRDGVFHSLDFDFESNTFSNHQSVKFAAGSTSTPTIHARKAYLGGIGGSGNWGDPGVFAVINLETMSLEYQNQEIDGEVKSAPLVIYDADGIYAYFTANSEAGLLYAYHDGAVEVAYTPTESQRQYTTATPILDADGNILYTTDAAILSLIAMKSSPETPVPSEPDNSETKPDVPDQPGSETPDSDNHGNNLTEPSDQGGKTDPTQADTSQTQPPKSEKTETTTTAKTGTTVVKTAEISLVIPFAASILLAAVFLVLRKKISEGNK